MIPVISIPAEIPNVPFYSQFADVTATSWKKRACGVVSIAMVLDYYSEEKISVDSLLTEAIKSGAYLDNAGWTHAGLISLAKKHGLTGSAQDLSKSSKKTAYAVFAKELAQGPVIVSIYYKFDPKSTIPHLVVMDGADGDYLYYNDPAATGGQKKISVTDFQKGWKQRFIVVRPVEKKVAEVVLPVAVAQAEATQPSLFARALSLITTRFNIG